MIRFTRFFYALSLVLALSACESEEPTPGGEGLVGTWVTVSFGGQIESSTMVSGSQISSTTTIEGANMNYEVTFTEDAFSTQGGMI